jgi:hypothetical protein
MGGNVDGSSAGSSFVGRVGGGVARCWVLKGQPCAGSPSVPGSGPRPHRRLFGRAGGLLRGLGFGGVFVNWIVDASI